MDVSELNFQSAVIERSQTVPVVVDFWAEWCGPCRQLGPVIERAVAARAGRVELAKVDVDANQALARTYGIQSIPAVKAFSGGAVASEFVGVQPPAAIERFLDALLPSEADGLVAQGDEESLRRAVELEPSRADARFLWPGSCTVAATPRARWRCSGRSPGALPPTGSRPGSGSPGLTRLPRSPRRCRQLTPGTTSGRWNC